jgi:hypothetical protein
VITVLLVVALLGIGAGRVRYLLRPIRYNPDLEIPPPGDTPAARRVTAALTGIGWGLLAATPAASAYASWRDVLSTGMFGIIFMLAGVIADTTRHAIPTGDRPAGVFAVGGRELCRGTLGEPDTPVWALSSSHPVPRGSVAPWGLCQSCDAIARTHLAPALDTTATPALEGRPVIIQAVEPARLPPLVEVKPT